MTHVWTYGYIRVYCFYGCKCLSVYICLCARGHVYIHVSEFVCMYVCMGTVHVCMHVYVCTSVCVHVPVHFYAHLCLSMGMFLVTGAGDRNAGMVMPTADLATAALTPQRELCISPDL